MNDLFHLIITVLLNVILYTLFLICIGLIVRTGYELFLFGWNGFDNIRDNML